AADLDELLDRSPARPDLLGQAAMAYSLCASAARGEQHDGLADRYGGRAVACLRQLHRSKHIAPARLLQDLKGLTEFAALRGRGDFRELVKSVEAEIQKPGR